MVPSRTASPGRSRRTRRSSGCWSCTARWPACRASERDEGAKEIWRIAIDEQWGIGTVGLAAANLGVRLVKNNMGNVPERLSQVRAARHPGASAPGDVLLQVGFREQGTGDRDTGDRLQGTGALPL